MEDKFKVVTDPGGTLVYAGPMPTKGKPTGASEDAAQQDADRRNHEAEGMGIQTRYVVAPFA